MKYFIRSLVRGILMPRTKRGKFFLLIAIVLVLLMFLGTKANAQTTDEVIGSGEVTESNVIESNGSPSASAVVSLMASSPVTTNGNLTSGMLSSIIRESNYKYYLFYYYNSDNYDARRYNLYLSDDISFSGSYFYVRGAYMKVVWNSSSQPIYSESVVSTMNSWVVNMADEYSYGTTRYSRYMSIYSNVKGQYRGYIISELDSMKGVLTDVEKVSMGIVVVICFIVIRSFRFKFD